MIERGLTMLLHSAIIAIIAYVIMKFLLNQPQLVSENRSLLIGAGILAYMILFGHGLPTKLNPNL
jgi:hypothetical protein